MKPIEVLWSATDCADIDDEKAWETPIVTDWSTELQPWAEVATNGERAAEVVLEHYFGTSEWEKQFGADADTWMVHVVIHSPPAIAGRYEVDLERVTKARAKELRPREELPGCVWKGAATPFADNH